MGSKRRANRAAKALRESSGLAPRHGAMGPASSIPFGGLGPGIYTLDRGKVASFSGVTDRDLPAADTSTMSARDIYAEAVHLAVCDCMGTVDISGHCMASTYAGWVLTIAHPPGPGKWFPQAGSLYIKPNPDHPTAAFGFRAEDGGMERGEFHAWLAHQDGTRIDFSARYYRRYVETMAASGVEGLGPDEVRWNRPDPPAYLWAHYSDLPDWVTLHTDEASSRTMWENFQGKHAGWTTLRRSVYRHYDRLKAAR